ncbi:IS66-like element accessory protein TnpA [Roseateles sp. DC23W]|uniref:IS66-like element accessory protein TnpA n=1 Tax=Pelomonas dachongensis TaxID=3299029 RepID=A0ABW7EV32_9BURK
MVEPTAVSLFRIAVHIAICCATPAKYAHLLSNFWGSVQLLGGHVNTTTSQQAGTRRRRRRHSDEFKADLVAACSQPGISIAAVAMANSVNANLLRRWVAEAEMKATTSDDGTEIAVAAAKPKTTPAFVPVSLPSPATPAMSPDIRIELQRGATAVTVTWPASAAAECAAWMRELLR